MRRSLLLAVLCLSTLTLQAKPPNIVVILSDDQGWGDLSANGNKSLQTPNIDSLARDGVSFDRFFVCPVCSPTRAEFLTGRYHTRLGVSGTSSGQERLNLGETTIAECFKAVGYATGAFGKWHSGSQWPYHPNARGFDEFYGFTSGHWAEYFQAPLEHNGKPVRGKGYIADDFTDEAMRFIETNKDKPFFCYVPYNTPHSPFAVPDEYWQQFKNKDIQQRGSAGNAEDIDETRCVLAMCENLDWNVGRLLSKLKELKLEENTIVLYFCDNGPNTNRWNGEMKGRKGSTDEGGVRSPLFIRWPGKLPSGGVVKQISGAVDVMPTLISLVGIQATGSKPLDGVDLRPLLTGEEKAWQERNLFNYWNGKLSVRSQRYRLANDGALYDMLADPSQKHDIANSHPEIAESLGKAASEWRSNTGANSEADAKKKNKQPDNRPYPVGYVEFPSTILPARDGEEHGGIKRSASAPNSSFFTNWKSTDDSITWNIDVHTAGEYEVELLYTCAVEDVGAEIELSHQAAKLTASITEAWDPPFYTNQDTIPRPKAESQAKEFKPVKLGRWKLKAGQGALTLRALKIPGESVVEVRALRLTLLP